MGVECDPDGWLLPHPSLSFPSQSGSGVWDKVRQAGCTQQTVSSLTPAGDRGYSHLQSPFWTQGSRIILREKSEPLAGCWGRDANPLGGPLSQGVQEKKKVLETQRPGAQFGKIQAGCWEEKMFGSGRMLEARTGGGRGNSPAVVLGVAVCC